MSLNITLGTCPETRLKDGRACNWIQRGVGGESVVADEPCEAASGGAAVVKSAFTVNQAYRVYRFCDRFAIERSLVLLVNGYKGR